MKVVLVGAVESTATALAAMVESGHTPDLLVTLPLEFSRRHSDFVDLASMATSEGIPIHRTEKSDGPETLQVLTALAPDLVLVIGWSQICGPAFRNIPRLGCLGFHPSALPRLRGRAVIPWTILTGEDQSGGTLFWMDEGVDTGDIAAQSRFPIDPERETARGLYDKQTTALTGMLPPLLDRISAGDVPRIPQDHDQSTWCARRRRSDGHINWARPMTDIHRLIRAVGPPYPGAYFEAGPDTQVTITAARPDPRSGRFIGVTGQIQAVQGNCFTVMCGDGGCLEITDWASDSWTPVLHAKLCEG
ncbi:MAG: methionyl-tRNA formyltransferase [Dinoroseobacter sp.]|nr:methionyl-tRNA formyltransferase [Dinoroseobacter sp.]